MFFDIFLYFIYFFISLYLFYYNLIIFSINFFLLRNLDFFLT